MARYSPRRAVGLALAGLSLAAAPAIAPRPAPGPPAAWADFGKDEKKFPNEAYPAEFRARVVQSIVRGANWLLTHQRDDGSWADPNERNYPMGATALATLALLKSGIPAGHPKVEKAFAFLRKQPLARTYEVGILLMALDAKYDPAPDPFAKEEVDRYGNLVVVDPCADRISKEDLAWMRQGVEFLLKNQSGGHWRYPDGGFDLSNTQYALLGLKAADRCGLKVPLQAWIDSLDFLLSFQDADGAAVDVRANEVRGDYRVEWTEKAKARGFAYTTGARGATGSMTTAGAAGLLICQSMLWKSRKFGAEARAQTRSAIRDSLAWMEANFDVARNPGAGMGPGGGPRGMVFGGPWHYYYLYGLERMGIAGHVRFLGRHDWYAEGAELLMAAQDPADSSWNGRDVVDTCFALLFLKRGSFRTANPTITETEPPAAAPRPSPPGREPGDAGGR